LRPQRLVGSPACVVRASRSSKVMLVRR
jgi:hypothetical protein